VNHVMGSQWGDTWQYRLIRHRRHRKPWRSGKRDVRQRSASASFSEPFVPESVVVAASFVNSVQHRAALMGRTRDFDEATAVRAARDVFWEHGYASTSLTQLQAATRLSRSSLYSTFGSKRGLFEAVTQHYLNDVVGPLLEPLEVPGAGQREIVAYFHSLSDFVTAPTRPAATRGCLILNTTVELNALDDQATLMVQRYLDRVDVALFAALTMMSATISDPRGKADILSAGQLGIMVTARVNPIRAAAVARAIAAEVQSW
jgi:TetR/AcrR family transcriptional regulator, transcriptional repressor for nem operon